MSWNHNWIGGKKMQLDEQIEVRNPATGEVVGSVPMGGEAETVAAIDAAYAAFPTWSRQAAHKRSAYLQEWADRIIEDQGRLARLMTLEQGKPLTESLDEIEGAVAFICWYAEEAKRNYGEWIPPSHEGKRILVTRQPVGVAGLITPWNFPAAMVTRKMAPALAAGCTVVLKPASQTPQIAVALMDHLMATGIPAGVANIVTGRAAIIGETLLSDRRVRKISFTGSTAIGKELMRRSADHVKRISLELGGNAPVIVFPDADLNQAAEAIVDNKFENCGQMCNGINVVYVHQAIVDDFRGKLVEKVQSLQVGLGTEVGVQVGPLIDEAAVSKVEGLLQDAIAKGARVLTGGVRLQEGSYQHGNFFAPTVIDQVDERMALAHEEIFGPVAPLLTFADEEEVLTRCNETPYGLAAYVFTRDVGRVFRMSEALEFGMVAVNGTSLSVPQAPFGGIKESGNGREGGHHGMEEYLQIKYVSLTL